MLYSQFISVQIGHVGVYLHAALGKLQAELLTVLDSGYTSVTHLKKKKMFDCMPLAVFSLVATMSDPSTDNTHLLSCVPKSKCSL